MIAMAGLVHPNPTPANYPSDLAGPSRLATLPAQLPLPHRSHPPPSSMPPPSSTLPSRKRKLAPTQPKDSPVPSSPSASEGSADKDGEYEPITHPPARSASKRSKGASGAQAGGSSARGGSSTSTAGRGMSREALRKANHSLIERRRREKINHALGELRDMVPGLGDAEGGKGGEFKLEVLERTVIHMKELKAHIADLEARAAKAGSGGTGSSSSASSSSRTKTKSTSTSKKASHASPPPAPRHSISPPTPSQSPDPNETDAESNLPPPFAIASRPLPPSYSSPHSSPSSHSPPPRNSAPSITSLLASVPDRPSAPPSSRPAPASNQAYNPTLYLPFPTPSPTSPFLSYSHSTSASSSGPPEPSPFLAPLQGMALFGGALTLDNTILAPSPADALSARNPHADAENSRRQRRTSKEQEEAANLLLAFSSPDVMRPMGYMTPIVVPAEGLEERRGMLDAEEFVLDGGVRSGGLAGGRSKMQGQMRGKTARDILQM